MKWEMKIILQLSHCLLNSQLLCDYQFLSHRSTPFPELIKMY